MSPEFPIRILTDDGDCEVIDSPEELMARVHDFDSSDPRVWVRDAYDRTVHIVVRGGMVEVFAV
ncbi:MAG TPA: hypothetical protein VNI54_12780 [Thermoanaerobaculia bacterium]|nr:hypothetical protein [Thermoanaerobaculia bacterium]